MTDNFNAPYLDATAMVAAVTAPVHRLWHVPMTIMNMPWVNQVADALYPDHPETPHVLFERLTLFPQGCFILWGETGDAQAPHQAVGYMVSHPWSENDRPPPVNGYLEGINFWRSRRYAIHDIAILPPYRRRGFAAQAVNWVKTFSAQTFESVDVLALGPSQPFWIAQGFEPSPVERAFRSSNPERETSGDDAHFRFTLT